MLVAPLDWGLGHATRCIPIINQLIALDCEVIIASEGPQKILLQSEFPSLQFFHLPGYHISYGAAAPSTLLKVILQIPKLLTAIRYERKWLEDQQKKVGINLLISDNRYGLHNKKLPCIFITHQLLIKTSFGRLCDRLLQKINYRLIGNFSECWVPDFDLLVNLAGGLSKPGPLPKTETKYIGGLSRFSGLTPVSGGKHLLVILSGPEPQRTILEQMLLTQFELYQGTVIIIRGLPGAGDVPKVDNRRLSIYNHLPTEEMHRLISDAKAVICRSGYTSVMDLIPAGIKCVFIPTPGQPEQEYLAKHLASKNFCLTYKQRSFSVSEMLSDLETFEPNRFETVAVNIKEIISETLRKALERD